MINLGKVVRLRETRRICG